MALTNCKLLVCLFVFSGSRLAQAECLRTVSDIKANSVKARWQEATANDGKPLMISISDGANGLVYSASKAGAPWLTGNVSVCRRSGSVTEITLKDTKATSNVPMLARLALPSTQTAQIVNDQIKLGGGGWGGTFVGQ
jgi:type IV secretory pathway VirJ component